MGGDPNERFWKQQAPHRLTAMDGYISTHLFDYWLLCRVIRAKARISTPCLGVESQQQNRDPGEALVSARAGRGEISAHPNTKKGSPVRLPISEFSIYGLEQTAEFGIVWRRNLEDIEEVCNFQKFLARIRNLGQLQNSLFIGG